LSSKAGGQVGTYIANAIIQAGKHNITGITRTHSKSQLPAGVVNREVNYEDLSTIASELECQDILIITMAVTATPGTHNKLVKAAADAGVSWVMPNEFSIGENTQGNEDTFLGDAKQAERDFIDTIDGISWVGLASGFWYEFSLSGGAGDRYGFNVVDGKRESQSFVQVPGHELVRLWQHYWRSRFYRMTRMTRALLWMDTETVLYKLSRSRPAKKICGLRW